MQHIRCDDDHGAWLDRLAGKFVRTKGYSADGRNGRIETIGLANDRSRDRKAIGKTLERTVKLLVRLGFNFMRVGRGTTDGRPRISNGSMRPTVSKYADIAARTSFGSRPESVRKNGALQHVHGDARLTFTLIKSVDERLGGFGHRSGE